MRVLYLLDCYLTKGLCSEPRVFCSKKLVVKKCRTGLHFVAAKQDMRVYLCFTHTCTS